MNFTVTSKGRQFDRLGLMYLGDIEVFRTSTAEPTSNGIVWTYIKEMDHYEALWKTEQKIIFDLGNLIDSTYTAPFNTLLTATFFTVRSTKPAADQILPISARRSSVNGPSAFSLPSDDASVTYKIPQNTERAVVSLSACGQATEEFWYTNVLNSQVDTFADQVGSLYGYSPYRELQLLIDDQLAGASLPFPVVFTGGIVPGLWRPIVGTDAFDLKEKEIDVTPWLPILCDGASHKFEIRVVGLNDDGNGKASLSDTVGSSWIVTGKIFLFLGPEGSVTSGTPPKIETDSSPEITVTSRVMTNSTGGNETLDCALTYQRTLSITSNLKTSDGRESAASWHQTLRYWNNFTLSSYGYTQVTKQDSHGIDHSASGLSNDYEYLITVNSTFSTSPGTLSINADFERGVNIFLFGPSVFPSSLEAFAPGIANPRNLYIYARPRPYPLALPPDLPRFIGSHEFTDQNGYADYFSGGNRSRSSGLMSQIFAIKGWERTDEPTDGTVLFDTFVRARDGRVTDRDDALLGRPIGGGTGASTQVGEGVGLGVQEVGPGKSVKELLGRGPGSVGKTLVGTGGAGR